MLKMQQQYRNSIVQEIISYNKPAKFKITEAGKNNLPFHPLSKTQITNLTQMLKDDKISIDFVGSVGTVAEKGISDINQFLIPS